MKAILIGRHNDTSELIQAGIEIVGNDPRPVMFPATAADCKPVLENLLAEAEEAKAGLLFQAIPNQLAVAIALVSAKDCATKIGAVVSIPGPRLAENTQTFVCADVSAVGAIESAAKFANGRAKVQIIGPNEVRVTVDPFSPVRMSHIQWFDGTTGFWTIRGFFNRHGFPMKWLNSNEGIAINLGNSNEFPEVNGGKGLSIGQDKITIHEDEDRVELLIKVKNLNGVPRTYHVFSEHRGAIEAFVDVMKYAARFMASSKTG